MYMTNKNRPTLHQAFASRKRTRSCDPRRGASMLEDAWIGEENGLCVRDFVFITVPAGCCS